MANIVIYDDDLQSISTLRKLVEQCAPAHEAYEIFSASSSNELEAMLNSGMKIDILFADIIMPNGQPSGIEVVQRLFPPESGTQVIFASGYLQQATEVYAANHLYFLLKPIDRQKLSDALSKAFASLTRRTPTMLRVKAGHKDRLINISTIAYLESSLHKVIIHCRSNSFETYAKLDELQAQLPDSFTRCHRSYVVNLAFVSSLNEGELRLHDGTTLPISRRRAHQVQHDLLAYLSSHA